MPKFNFNYCKPIFKFLILCLWIKLLLFNYNIQINLTIIIIYRKKKWRWKGTYKWMKVRKTELAGLGLCAPWYGMGNGVVVRVAAVVSSCLHHQR